MAEVSGNSDNNESPVTRHASASPFTLPGTSGAGDSYIFTVGKMAENVIYIKWWLTNWTEGTRWMTRLERGAYHDLLMHQASNGHMTEDMIKRILGDDYQIVWPVISEKFIKDQDGLFYNKKMNVEVASIREYCKSRGSNSRKNKGLTHKSHDSDMKDTSESYDEHVGIKSKSVNNNNFDHEKDYEERKTAVDDPVAFILNGQPWTWKRWQGLCNLVHDRHIAGRILFRARNAENPYAWIKSGLSDEKNRYALSATEDEEKNKQEVEAWVSQLFKSKTGPQKMGGLLSEATGGIL